jgi:uroporphyrinogen-III decarboxylase
MYAQQFDLETMMTNALECLTAEAFLPGDNVPGFWSDLGPVVLASAFGGKLRFEENGPPWIDPIVFAPEQVYAVRKPSIQDGLVGETLRRAQVFLERCQGKISIRSLDMQGPLNTAGLIWEQQDFLMAMRSHPKEVHYLVNLVTEYLIDVYQAFITTFGSSIDWPHFPPIWMPPDFGVGIIEDLLPLISAKYYREYGLPYTTRIAELFGGVAIHCCGECERHLPALAEIPNLRLLDFHYPHTRPEVVQEVLGDGKRVFCMNLSPRGSHLFPGKYDFLKFQQNCYEKGMRQVIFLSGNQPDGLKESLNVLGLGKTWDCYLEGG